ncbi:MAG: DnaA regulatory inactivator Hda [Gammaproteobacteria bacterium]|nr:DnaA regulatory inactivator Hda [Gammaproteobacteria bacterium]
MKIQIPLNIKLSDAYSFDNFFSDSNKQLVDCLQQLVHQKERQFIYIWGSTGRGKTHLLSALCRYYLLQEDTAFYLPLKDKHGYSINILENLEDISLVAIDDIDEVAGNTNWEEALFHFYNCVKDRHSGHLIISGNAGPGDLGIKLNDLSSRLNWDLVFQISTLIDDEKVIALQKRAHYRGLDLSNDAASYLLKRCPRDLPFLFAFLDKLDLASLAAKRKLTIPFIKSLL